jgi:hypothetical protein
MGGWIDEWKSNLKIVQFLIEILGEKLYDNFRLDSFIKDEKIVYTQQADKSCSWMDGYKCRSKDCLQLSKAINHSSFSKKKLTCDMFERDLKMVACAILQFTEIWLVWKE